MWRGMLSLALGMNNPVALMGNSLFWPLFMMFFMLATATAPVAACVIFVVAPYLLLFEVINSTTVDIATGSSCQAVVA